jgi:ABC-type amino acid transport substrate-binding protein
MRPLLLALLFIAGTCLAQTPTIDKIKKSGTITLGYVDGVIPFSFVRDVKPEGYSVELCERVVGDLRQQLKLPKLETRWVKLTSQDRIEAVRKGQVDLECSTAPRSWCATAIL